MIVGVGIDIIEVDRVAEKVNKDSGFKEKVFSAAEIGLCGDGPQSAQHYAGRFAAKEAFLKATGYGFQLGLELYEIEILQDNLGKPFFNLRGAMKAQAEQKHWKKMHVSISHIQAAACAVVILES